MKDLEFQLNKMKVAVYEGEADPLESYAELKGLEAKIKEVKEVVESAALAEAEKFGDKTFSHKGLNFERRQGRAVWNFKNIDTWSKRKKELTEFEKECKAAYQASLKGKQMVDDNGELVPIPEVTYTKDSLIVKAAK